MSSQVANWRVSGTGVSTVLSTVLTVRWSGEDLSVLIQRWYRKVIALSALDADVRDKRALVWLLTLLTGRSLHLPGEAPPFDTYTKMETYGR